MLKTRSFTHVQIGQSSPGRAAQRLLFRPYYTTLSLPPRWFPHRCSATPPIKWFMEVKAISVWNEMCAPLNTLLTVRSSQLELSRDDGIIRLPPSEEGNGTFLDNQSACILRQTTKDFSSFLFRILVLKLLFTSRNIDRLVYWSEAS